MTSAPARPDAGPTGPGRPRPGLAPYDRAMGFRLLEAGPGRTVLEADADARWHNPTGVLHGGVITGLADSAMGLAVCALCDDGETATNLDLDMRFFRPTAAGRLRAESRVVRAGRRVVQMECDVTDGDGRLVARAASAFLRIPLG